MKKMKRWLLLLLAVVCMFSLTACGNSGGGDDDEEEEETEELSEDDFIGTWSDGDDDGVKLVLSEDGEGVFTLEGDEYDISWKLKSEKVTFKVDGEKYSCQINKKGKLKVEGGDVSATLDKQKASKKKKDKDKDKDEDKDKDDEDDPDDAGTGKSSKSGKTKKSASIEAGTYEGSYYVSVKYENSTDPLDFNNEHSFRIVLEDDGTGTYTKADGYDYEITIEADGEDLKCVLDGWDEVPGKLESDRLIVYDGDPAESYTYEYIFALPGGDPGELLPDCLKNANSGTGKSTSTGGKTGGDDDISTVDWDTVVDEGDVTDSGLTSAGRSIDGTYDFYSMVMDGEEITADMLGGLTFQLILTKDGKCTMIQDTDTLEFLYEYDAATGFGEMWEEADSTDIIEFMAVEQNGYQYLVMAEDEEYIIFVR